MIIRLTTDASLCTETKAGAWAAVVRGRLGYREFGGIFQGNFGGINGLELHAAAAGLRCAVDAAMVGPGDHLVF